MIRFFHKIKYVSVSYPILIYERYFEKLHIQLGLNSAILSFIFFIMLYFSSTSGVLHLSYLKSLSPLTSFIVTMFSVLLGVGLYYYWRLGKPSQYIFGLKCLPKPDNKIQEVLIFKNKLFYMGENNEYTTYEFNKLIRLFFSIAIFLLLFLTTINNAGLVKLASSPETLFEAENNYCPEEEEKTTQEKPGCELVIRAFNLGYADTLGSCAPEEDEADIAEVCEKRRRGEPYLHYFYRMLQSSLVNMSANFSYQTLATLKHKFRLQVSSVASLRDYQRYAITSSKRASHHIWTNLPYPGRQWESMFITYLKPSHCIKKYQNQSNTPNLSDTNANQTSVFLDHAYGQLLFNPKVNLSVGSCRESKIHWGASVDTCDTLSKNPTSVFERYNISKDIKMLVSRKKASLNIHKLNIAIDSINQKWLNNEVSSEQQVEKINMDISELNKVATFKCFMHSDKNSEHSKVKKFTYHDVLFDTSTHYFSTDARDASFIEIYNDLTHLLDPDFTHSAYYSRTDLDLSATKDGGESKKLKFNTLGFFMSRLEVLKNVDIFLDNQWIIDREDLLEVYPYHIHMRNYVENFRSSLKDKRERL